MADKKFTVLDLLSLELQGHDVINLRCIGGRKGLTRAITVPDINRPGLALSGFYESFASQRSYGRKKKYGIGCSPASPRRKEPNNL
jgi:HPr kinase/phosphorylase